ncbi:MAG: hypothetical protein JWQ51_460 [Tardiphaga sp.]|jgi:hypothetical protein|nr:hypothetical protein [Tardiphaga sp.]
MTIASGKRLLFGAIAAAALIASAPAAKAQDFFGDLFGGFGGRPVQRMVPTPFATEFGEPRVQRSYAPRSNGNGGNSSTSSSHSSGGGGGGGGQAFCVRTCDGRYFPISASDSQSKAASCNAFCPASETKVFHGSTIDHASTDSGKQYTALPNAFKFRNELVAGCTCNGKDQIGLAPVKIEDDPTLKRGDIVAGADGLMINRGADRRGASLNMSPAAQSIRAKYERLPVVAQE